MIQFLYVTIVADNYWGYWGFEN